MRAEVNLPGHIAHGLNGPVTHVEGTLFTLDIDGVPVTFHRDNLLFIRFVNKPEPLIDYWLRNFFWFVIGVAFGILARMVQE